MWNKVGPVLSAQTRVIDTIRAFFKSQNFLEVFTPILVPVPSCEPNLEVFETQLRTSKGAKRRGFLIMSPEYSIKKLLAQGIGNCFEITKCFRNEEEVSRLHNPEFMMLEWYRVNANYFDIMNDFEKLFLQIIGKNSFIYQGTEYDLTPPWPRISVRDAFEGNIPDEENFSADFFNKVEPKLTASRRPAFIYDYPQYQASLAKINSKGYAERFEVFLAGLELGNCFTELTNAAQQKKRFEKELLERKAAGKTEYPIDEEFIKALEKGLPEVAGIAVGVDRLVMLAADAPTISDVLSFPAEKLFRI
jgi:lysyl-tRNA synthetase class 2